MIDYPANPLIKKKRVQTIDKKNNTRSLSVGKAEVERAGLFCTPPKKPTASFCTI